MRELIAPGPPAQHTVVPPLITSATHFALGDADNSAGVMSEASRVPQTELDRPRALVVDDAPDVTEMLAMLLRYAGYEVVAVSSAPDAFDKAQSEQFDVVVSDIGMPGMNGYELAEALRTLPDYRAVPLIAVTGFAMYDDRDRALESGFDAFLTKPINPMDLIELIKRLRA